MRTEKDKNETLIEKYEQHKKFLDNLTPKDFIDARDKSIAEFVERFKQEWIENQINVSDGIFRQKYFLIELEQGSMISDSTFTKGFGGGRQAERRPLLHPNHHQVQISNLSQAHKKTLKQNLEEKFKEKLEKEEL